MVDVLVFSKDRAAQLDLLLHTIDEYAGELYSSITVLYTGSSRAYLQGYGVCYSEHPEVRFVLEHDFERQTCDWIREVGSRGWLLSFLVDDDVFTGPAPTGEEVETAFGDHGAPALSLRGGDYDYPFSVDGNIYRLADVINVLRGLRFRNPTELEHHAHLNRAKLPFKVVVPVEPPCLVGVPANRVSVSSGMPHMGKQAANLNERYLQGQRLAIVPQVVPAGMVHWPLDYHWLNEPAAA